MTQEPAPERRSYAVALGLLVLGAVGLIVSFGRTWSTTTVGGSGLPTVTVSLSGTDLTPAGVAVAVLALAGVVGLAATRRIGRVVIGVLLVVAGLAVSYVSVDFRSSWDSARGIGDVIRDLVSERAGVDGAGGSTTITSWWVLGLVAGLLVAAGGAVAVLRSGRWPAMGRRYERGDAAAGEGRPPREVSAWDQLDQGIDPTSAPGDQGADTSGDPTLRARDES